MADSNITPRKDFVAARISKVSKPMIFEVFTFNMLKTVEKTVNIDFC